MSNLNPKKVNYSFIISAYVGSVIFYTFVFDTGFLFALFVAIPSAPLVLIFGSIITGVIRGLLKPFLNWLRR